MTLDFQILEHIIIQYKKTQNKELISQFQELIYPFVMKWVQRQYKCGHDICHDYIVYLLLHAEQILLSYPEIRTSSLQTWFMAVLVNKFKDFIRQNGLSVTHVSLDDIEISSSSDIPIYHDLSSLSLLEQSLYIFCFRPQDIEAKHLQQISIETHKSMADILDHYQDILYQQEKKYTIVSNLQKQLDILNGKIELLKKRIRKEENPTKLIELEEKLAYFKNRDYKITLKIQKTLNINPKQLIKIFDGYQNAYRIIRSLQYKLSWLPNNESNDV